MGLLWVYMAQGDKEQLSRPHEDPPQGRSRLAGTYATWLLGEWVEGKGSPPERLLRRIGLEPSPPADVAFLVEPVAPHFVGLNAARAAVVYLCQHRKEPGEADKIISGQGCRYAEDIAWLGFFGDGWEAYEVGSLVALAWLSALKGVASGSLALCPREGCGRFFTRMAGKHRQKTCGQCGTPQEVWLQKRGQQISEDKVLEVYVSFQNHLRQKVHRREITTQEREELKAAGEQDLQAVREGAMLLAEWERRHTLPLQRRKKRILE